MSLETKRSSLISEVFKKGKFITWAQVVFYLPLSAIFYFIDVSGLNAIAGNASLDTAPPGTGKANIACRCWDVPERWGDVSLVRGAFLIEEEMGRERDRDRESN
ncbi:hypothetical protein ElyMa_005575700 [Elysia marginata]|uniref:Uncharacterized protein n=1 Tax=Elysia marginata TaxID=1093978 RepID=A0AAV4F181_9GAST|nr:hypothetical protein ElyMa_005575700 [Elysia marginata]